MDGRIKRTERAPYQIPSTYISLGELVSPILSDRLYNRKGPSIVVNPTRLQLGGSRSSSSTLWWHVPNKLDSSQKTLFASPSKCYVWSRIKKVIDATPVTLTSVMCVSHCPKENKLFLNICRRVEQYLSNSRTHSFASIPNAYPSKKVHSPLNLHWGFPNGSMRATREGYCKLLFMWLLSRTFLQWCISRYMSFSFECTSNFFLKTHPLLHS